MLKVLRDSMKYLAWILWAVIAVFVLFVFVDFGSGVPQGQLPTQNAATVGAETVSYREFEREYRDMEQQMRQQLGEQLTPELAEQLRLPLQALDRVINRKILRAEARRLGLAVSDEELRESILELPVFADTQGRFVGQETYGRVLRSLGYTPDQFEAVMREQLLVQRLLSALGQAVVVSDGEVEQRYRQDVERASIRYLSLPFGELRGEIEVAPDEVQRHFAAHREEYRLPERRVAQYLLVDQRALQDGAELSEEELSAYYDERRGELAEREQVRARHVLVESREEAAQARRRIEAGEPFAQVASELSQDPGSASRGGDLGWFGRGRMVPQFEQSAFAAPVGELVGPIQTQFGFHLLEVLERREERVRPFEEVRELVSNRLLADRGNRLAEEQVRALAEQLRTQGEVTPERMQQLAVEREAVEYGATQPFEAAGPVPPLGTVPGLNQMAFQLTPGQLSEPVRVPRGWVVLRLAEVQEPRLPELAEVQAQVRRDVERGALERAALERLRQGRERLQQGAGLEEVAGDLGLAVQESQPFGRDGFVAGLGAAPELAAAALELEPGQAGEPLPVGDNAILFQVAERQRFDPVTFAAEADTLRQQLQQQQLDSLLTSLIRQRREELGVSYDRRLLESWKMLGGEQG
ncbi:MAG TPA: SurA N-terminal domain-containing protein [Thermoanaerobaculia bacterium]|nr:SurA N-terminal domain-containing protein [Thermoanaerobaculia bacterium]